MTPIPRSAFSLILRAHLLLALASMGGLPGSLGAPGDKKWEFVTGGAIRSSPALGSNGLVYFGSSDSKLYAVDAATGLERWHRETPGAVLCSPIWSADGIVYLNSLDGSIAALDGATGTPVWTNRLSETLSSPVLGANGLLYLATRARGIYALEAGTGQVVWSHKLENWENVYASPALGADGTIFCSSGGFELSGAQPRFFALDGDTGALKWKFASPNLMQSTPAIGLDGTVFIPSYDKMIYALDPVTGARLWQHLTADALSSSPALSPSGTLYVGGNDGRLYALDAATGTEQWTFLTGDTIHSSPAVAADGTVYFGSYDRHVYALDGTAGLEKWRFPTGGLVLSSPAVTPSGTVLIGSYDGKLYALEGSAPLAASPWPAFKAGSARASSAERPGPPVVVRPAPDRLEPAGASVSLNIVVGGSRPIRYQWLKGEQPLPNATNASLQISAALASDAGDYTLLASNVLGDIRALTRLRIGYVLSVPELGGGRVTREPDHAIYPPGTTVTLTPQPLGPRRFLGWRGDAAGIDNPLLVTMDRHKGVAARFELQPGEALWALPAQGTDSPVVIDTNNTVYVSGSPTNFLALDAGTGLVRWSIPATNQIRHTALGPSGSLIRASDPNLVYCADTATGQERWQTRVPGYIFARPAIGPDGTVYIPSENDGAARLIAIAGDTGAAKWRYSAGSSFFGAGPVIGANGLVYTTAALQGTTCRWKITALDPENGGFVRWSLILGPCAGSPIVPGGEGAVYIVSSDGILRALDAGTGRALWTFRLAPAVLLPPIVGPGETIYALDEHSRFIALDGRTGQKKTSFHQEDGVVLRPASPALTADGSLLALGPDKLIALDAVTGRRRWEAPVPGLIGQFFTIGPDGTVCAMTMASGQQRLAALLGAGPLAEAPWPAAASDSRNSGTASARPARILGVSLSGQDLKLTIWTRPGSTHHLEAADSLSAPVWVPIASLAGTGTEQVIIHPHPPSASQFYRLRIE